MGISRFFTSLFYKKHDKHIFVVLMVISISFVLCAYYDNHPGVGSKNSSGELSEYRKRHLEKHIKHGLGNNQNAKGFEMFQKDIVINKNRRLQGGLKFSNQTAKLDMAIQQYMKARGNNDMDNMELIMVPENLKTPDKQKWNYNVNSKVSDLIPINRVAPDLRWSGCKNIVYDTESLPKMTIVIPFYNEVASLLLRMLHSIFDRTPTSLIHEVVLVDDCSSNTNLLEPLEEYLKTMSHPIRLFRNEQRQGLMRTRQRAADNATGDVLVFLDSHIEVGYEWAEPLLQQLLEHPHRILQPGVTYIDKDTLKHGTDGANRPNNARTAFSWDLKIRYLDSAYHQPDFNPKEPYKVPSFLGCAIAVRRDFFQHLGGFDPALELWGGENFELGFQAWLCGDGAYTHPCSRVGHVFRPLPYTIENKERSIVRNLVRVAEVWMGNYTRFFYGALKSHVRMTPNDRRAIAERKALKNQLKCRDFSYIMEHVIPDMPVPSRDAKHFGVISPTVAPGDSCFLLNDKRQFVVIHYSACGGVNINPQRMFYVTHNGRFVHRNSKKCVLVDWRDKSLYADKCPPGEGWANHWAVKRTASLGDPSRRRHHGVHIYYIAERQQFCVTRPPRRDKALTRLFLQPCVSELYDDQTWQFTLDLD